MNQPFPSSRPPSTRGTDKMGGEAVEEEKEVTSMHSLDEWIARILSGLRDPAEACLSDARNGSPFPKSD